MRSAASSHSHHHPAVPAPGLGEPGTPTCTSQSVLGPPWPTSLHFTRLSASRPAPTSLQPQTEGRTPTPPRAPGGSEPGDRGGRTPTRRRCRRRLRGLRFRPNLIPARAPPPSTESRRGVQMDGVHVSPRGLPYSLDMAMCLIFMPSRGGGVRGLGQFLVTQSQAAPTATHSATPVQSQSREGSGEGRSSKLHRRSPVHPRARNGVLLRPFISPFSPKEVPAPRVRRWPRRARLCPDMIDSSSRCVSGAGRRWEAAGSPAVCSRSPVLKALRI